MQCEHSLQLAPATVAIHAQLPVQLLQVCNKSTSFMLILQTSSIFLKECIDWLCPTETVASTSAQRVMFKSSVVFKCFNLVSHVENEKSQQNF